MIIQARLFSAQSEGIFCTNESVLWLPKGTKLNFGWAWVSNSLDTKFKIPAKIKCKNCIFPTESETAILSSLLAKTLGFVNNETSETHEVFFHSMISASVPTNNNNNTISLYSFSYFNRIQRLINWKEWRFHISLL